MWRHNYVIDCNEYLIFTLSVTSIFGYIHCNFCLNPQIIHRDMKENVSGFFFSEQQTQSCQNRVCCRHGCGYVKQKVSYVHCVVCSMACEKISIQCCYCGRWTHIDCVEFHQSVLDVQPIDFVCKTCVSGQDGQEFSFGITAAHVHHQCPSRPVSHQLIGLLCRQLSRQSPADKVAPSAEDKCENSTGEECEITDVESGKVMVMILWISY